METKYDADSSKLELRFARARNLRAFVEDARDKKHFYLQMQEPPPPLSRVDVTICRGDVELPFRARVVQVFRSGASGHGTAFEVEDPEVLDPEALDSGSPAPETTGDGVSPEGENLGSSPVFRIQKMMVPERMRLATRAGKTERRILVRDSSPQVHMSLLANPHLEEAEVLELAKSGRTAGGVLKRIAGDAKWTTSYEIRLALVKNPQTPTPLAVSLLRRLKRPDLGALGKSQYLREAFKSVALRLYLKQM